MEIIKESVLPMLDRLISDPIPNIRFNVAKSYAILINTLSRLPMEGSLVDVEKEKSGKAATAADPSPEGRELIRSQIMPNLQKLQDDEDVDVRYFATTAASGDGSGSGGANSGGGMAERIETA